MTISHKIPSGLVVEVSPIDMLLAQQKQLQTPVSRFAEKHEKLEFPDQARFYKELLPLSRPQAGEQYAFQVDMDKCTGCKACVSACHSLNGLEEGETWRDVGLIHGGSAEQPYQQTITSACHHCADPACLNGCPVLAYEKDVETGIVRHLDDQCIGCQYCVLKCPYDVPKYSKTLGIVRKCDMCHSRLAEGEAPACVQACPTQAIRITVVPREASNSFLTVAHEPGYTQPTTSYVSSRPVPDNAAAADRGSLVPEHMHAPLMFMLILTQAAVGGLLFATLGTLLGASADWVRELLLGSAITLQAGLGASVLHLGKPLGAWRAFLGLRKSWLSREIVLFGALMPLTVAVTVVHWFFPQMPFRFSLLLGASGLGLCAVFTSVMIYHDTRRVFWRLPVSAGRFYGSVVILGLAMALVINAKYPLPGLQQLLGYGLVLATLLKLAGEALQLTRHEDKVYSPSGKSARLLMGPLRRVMGSRFIWAILGGVLLPLYMVSMPEQEMAGAGVLAFLILLMSELLERRLYFQAVVAPKMPGGFRA